MTDQSDLITTKWLSMLAKRKMELDGSTWKLGVGGNGRPCVVKQMGLPPSTSTVFHIRYGSEELARVTHRSEVMAFCEILGVAVELAEVAP